MSKNHSSPDGDAKSENPENILVDCRETIASKIAAQLSLERQAQAVDGAEPTMHPDSTQETQEKRADNPGTVRVDQGLLDSALDYLTHPSGRGLRKDMERSIREAIGNFQILNRESLRWSGVHDELKEMNSATVKLAKLIRRTSDVAISRLGASPTLSPFFRKAYDANGIQIESRGQWDDTYERGANGSEILQLLDNISRAAGAETDPPRGDKWEVDSDEWVKDNPGLHVPRGGAGHFPQANFPKHELVRDCFRIFKAAGRTKTFSKRKSFDKNDFRDFVPLMYEMATKEKSSLTRIINAVIKEGIARQE